MTKLASFQIQDWLLINTRTGAGIKDSAYETKGFFDFLAIIIKNVYIIAGIILFLFVIIGGLGMILNAGNVDKQKQGSKTLGSAVMGYFIMFAAYWIIRIIEALTGTTLVKF